MTYGDTVHMTADKRARSTRWMPIVLPVVLSLILSSAYLLLVFQVGEGRPVAPLDDSYIFFQYARQIARGHDSGPPAHRQGRGGHLAGVLTPHEPHETLG